MEKSFFRLLRQIVLLGLRTSVLACVIFSTLEPAPAQIPKRINKAIELLSQGQPNYHTMANDKSYEGGKKMAQTWADYITYDMEHNPLDIPRLARFMQGLLDEGPTKSGHRTPAMVVTLPVDQRSRRQPRTQVHQEEDAVVRLAEECDDPESRHMTFSGPPSAGQGSVGQGSSGQGFNPAVNENPLPFFAGCG